MKLATHLVTVAVAASLLLTGCSTGGPAAGAADVDPAVTAKIDAGLAALAAMRPLRDSPVSWDLFGRLCLVAHHPVIAAGAAGGRAWQLVKHRLSAPVADIIAGAAEFLGYTRV